MAIYPDNELYGRQSPVRGSGSLRGIVTDSIRDLSTLNSSTEQDFLSIGDHLSAVSTEARAVSDLARSVSDLMLNGEVASDTLRLKEVLEEVDHHFSFSRESIEGSSRILSTVKEMIVKAETPLMVFKKIVKHLHILGISTKIESERFHGG